MAPFTACLSRAFRHRGRADGTAVAGRVVLRPASDGESEDEEPLALRDLGDLVDRSLDIPDDILDRRPGPRRREIGSRMVCAARRNAPTREETKA
ncbi:MAG: hypothetical protein ACRDRK_25600 [Pseudonocardia sp.]